MLSCCAGNAQESRLPRLSKPAPKSNSSTLDAWKRWNNRARPSAAHVIIAVRRFIQHPVFRRCSRQTQMACEGILNNSNDLIWWDSAPEVWNPTSLMCFVNVPVEETHSKVPSDSCCIRQGQSLWFNMVHFCTIQMFAAPQQEVKHLFLRRSLKYFYLNCALLSGTVSPQLFKCPAGVFESFIIVLLWRESPTSVQMTSNNFFCMHYFAHSNCLLFTKYKRAERY